MAAIPTQSHFFVPMHYFIRTPLKAISSIGRVTQGVRVMRFKEGGDRIASVTVV